MAAIENKGNIITRRAFAGDNGERESRMKLLRRIVNKAMSTAYQMTEEVGDYGSGTPSPLHMLCEMVRECEECDRKEECEISTAQELAEYALHFLRQLRGDVVNDTDAIGKLNFLLKNASDANYALAGRSLDVVPPGELKEIGQKAMNCAVLARELGEMIDAQVQLTESRYPGAPMQGERRFKQVCGGDR